MKPNFSRRDFLGKAAVASGAGLLITGDVSGLDPEKGFNPGIGITEAYFNVKDFNAQGDGSTDDTEALQAAMDEAGKYGGHVYLPPAHYLVSGSLHVPPGVSVIGAAQMPQYSDTLKGSVILATGGRDDEDAPALFEMGSSCSVSGLTVYYPEQLLDDIHPYPWTFHLQGKDNTVENVTLVNSYNGISVGPETHWRHRIRSVYGCVLRRGLRVDRCVDIGRIDNVQFHSHWWYPVYVGGNGKKINEYMINNLEAFIFGRTDWEYVTNTFVFPCKIGYRFIKTESGMCNGQYSGIGADRAQRCMVVEDIQYMGLLITNGEFVAFEGNNPVEIELLDTCTGNVRFVNCAFWGPADQNVISRSKGFLSFSDCFFSSNLKGEKLKPLIEFDGGKVQVRGCSFLGNRDAVLLKPGTEHAIISENTGTNGVNVINEIGDNATIIHNEPPK